MKEKIIAFGLFFLVICFVFINTLLLGRQIDGLYDGAAKIEISDSDIPAAERSARELYEEFKKREKFISLTVNHEDLTRIEESFSEIIGYLSVGDADGAKVIKNRLLDSLRRRSRCIAFQSF